MDFETNVQKNGTVPTQGMSDNGLPVAGLNVAIVGATEMVGQEVLRTLAARRFPIETLKLLDTPIAIGSGRWLTYAPSTSKQRDIAVQEITGRAFRNIDLAIFCTDAEVAQHYIPLAADTGAFVIDVSGALRGDERTLAVVPEINGGDLAQLSAASFVGIVQPQRKRRIVVSPDAAVIQLMIPLMLVRRLSSIKRISVHTLMPVSESGQKTMEQLTAETKTVMEGRAVIPHAYAHQIAFNILPETEPILDNGMSKNEWRLIKDVRRIWGDATLPIIAAAVRVPVYVGQSQTVTVDLGRYMGKDEFYRIISTTPGVRLLDDTSVGLYPQPWASVNQDEVTVGRIREVDAAHNSVAFFSTMDNLRKGAALNAVQIAEAALELKII